LFTSEAGRSHSSLCPDCAAKKPKLTDQKRRKTGDHTTPPETALLETDLPTLRAIINLLERKGLITREEILTERSRLLEKK
jgi:hypothetical protein